MDRLRDAGPHPGGAADHAVEAGVVDHLDDRRHAGALLADQPGRGGVELDLAGGVGAVAELVLQALQAEAVALAVGRPAREEEAGDAAVGLGEDEEGVAHRRRHEPLVAGQLVLGAGAAAVRAARATVVLARTSVPPCFSVIPIPARAPRFSRGRQRCAGRIRARGSAAPTRRPAPAACAGPGSPSRSSRSGSRSRPRPATCT